MSPLESQMRNNVSKLHDQETLNLGQIHLIMRVICQEGKPTAKIREQKPPRVDLCLPAEHEHHYLPHWSQSLPPAHFMVSLPQHRTVWKWNLTVQSTVPHARHQANGKDLGSMELMRTPPGSGAVICSSHSCLS